MIYIMLIIAIIELLYWIFSKECDSKIMMGLALLLAFYSYTL